MLQREDQMGNLLDISGSADITTIPNDCDITTELVPNEIEYDHRTY
jgi:hypothetical protein